MGEEDLRCKPYCTCLLEQAKSVVHCPEGQVNGIEEDWPFLMESLWRRASRKNATSGFFEFRAIIEDIFKARFHYVCCGYVDCRALPVRHYFELLSSYPGESGQENE